MRHLNTPVVRGMLFVGLCGLTPVARPGTMPPISAQEMHTWQKSPINSPPDYKTGFNCWGNGITGRVRPEAPWRRDTPMAVYPYIGPYTDATPLVVEWQLGQARNCGLSTIFVQQIPSNTDGTTFINEHDFQVILARAEKMKYPVAVMDDSYFSQPPVQRPEHVVPRIAAFLTKYGTSPGYFRMEGRPVYLLDQNFADLTPEQVDRMLRDIEARLGYEVYWVLSERWDVDRIAKVGAAKAIRGHHSLYYRNPAGKVVSAQNNLDGDYYPEIYRQMQKQFVDTCHQNGKKAWAWLCPFIDSRGLLRPADYQKNGAGDRFDDRGGKTLEDLLEISRDNGCDHIVVGSWSCYHEGTQLEASWDFDGFRGDPFARQKIIARALGRKWHDPPPPDPSIVDPLLFGKVFGKDGIGPQIRSIRVESGDLQIMAADDASSVAKVELWINGSIYLLAAEEGLRSKGLALPDGLALARGSDDLPSVTLGAPLKITQALPDAKSAWIYAVASAAPAEDRVLVPPTDPLDYHWFLPAGSVCPMFGAVWEKTLIDSFVVSCVNQPIWYFGLTQTQELRAQGSFHYVAIVHPSDPDYVYERPIETSYGGREAVFRADLPATVKTGDFLIAVGWDKHGNRGEPFFKRVAHLR
jgi:hypothetical protein